MKNILKNFICLIFSFSIITFFTIFITQSFFSQQRNVDNNVHLRDTIKMNKIKINEDMNELINANKFINKENDNNFDEIPKKLVNREIDVKEDNDNDKINIENRIKKIKSSKMWINDGFDLIEESHYSQLKTAFVIVCYNRPDYLKRTFKSITNLYSQSYPPNKPDLYISQDGDINEVTEVIEDYINESKFTVNHIKHKQYIGKNGYESLSQHYHWIFKYIYSNGYDQIILAEDDMEFAPDFFEYLLGLADILKEDSSYIIIYIFRLMCISAWNDLGQKGLVKEYSIIYYFIDVIYRSDFFPGLGWLSTKEFYNEIDSKWPLAYWDDWLRSPEIRKNRSCIIPEISRSYTFGKSGTSVGQYFDKYLEPIKLNDKPYMWSQIDKSLLYKFNYDESLNYFLSIAEELYMGDFRIDEGNNIYKYICHYTKEYEKLTQYFGIMNDFKSGVPRGGYNNIVHIRWLGNLIFIVINLK